ncbi:MAG: hypothetical protein Q9220_001792 [cf. Caloplaca sp. 1 TL-2023]
MPETALTKRVENLQNEIKYINFLENNLKDVQKVVDGKKIEWQHQMKWQNELVLRHQRSKAYFEHNPGVLTEQEAKMLQENAEGVKAHKQTLEIMKKQLEKLDEDLQHQTRVLIVRKRQARDLKACLKQEK